MKNLLIVTALLSLAGCNYHVECIGEQSGHVYLDYKLDIQLEYEPKKVLAYKICQSLKSEINETIIVYSPTNKAYVLANGDTSDMRPEDWTQGMLDIDPNGDVILTYLLSILGDVKSSFKKTIISLGRSPVVISNGSSRAIHLASYNF